MPKQPKQAKYKIQSDFILNTSKSYIDVCEFLKQNPSLDLATILDKKGNTGLHIAAYRPDGIKLLKKYLDYMEKYWSKHNLVDPENNFMQFVNQSNKDGMTALHMACFKGNYKTLDELIKIGADYRKLTKTNQNVLHVAAQGGRLEAFIFFEALVDINSLDSKNSTPLHWACFMGDELIISYLLTRPNIKIDEMDHNQQTPLHLATSYGFTKIVKQLLRAGADRHIKNKMDKIPYEIAKQNEFKNIQRILNDNFSCVDKCKLALNIKTVYEPQERSKQKPIIFIVLLFIFVAFRMVLFTEEKDYENIRIFQITLFASIFLLFCSLIGNPVKKQPQKYINFLNAQKDFKKVCLPCANLKPKRSSHCDVCKMCFEQYDHHCYWINNCVSKNNIKRFIGFIYMFQIFLFYLLAFSVLIILTFQIFDETKIFKPRYIIISDDFHYVTSITIAFIIAVFSFLFSFPMIALIFVQTRNLFLGETTYERYTKDRGSTFTSTSTSLMLQDEIQKRDEKTCSFANVMKMVYKRDETDHDVQRDSLLVDE